MGFAVGLIRTVMFVFNLVVAITYISYVQWSKWAEWGGMTTRYFFLTIVGLLVIIVGVAGMYKVGYLKEFIPDTLTFIPKLTLIFGIIVFVISFLGCCGVYRKSKYKLILYAVILLIIFLVQFIISIWGIVITNDSKDRLLKQTETKLTNITKNYDKLSTEAKESMDFIQQNFECCGVIDAFDYTNHIPISCCDFEETTCDEETYFPEGCLMKVTHALKRTINIVIYILFSICGVELLGALFAIYLIFSFKKEVPVVQEVPVE